MVKASTAIEALKDCNSDNSQETPSFEVNKRYPPAQKLERQPNFKKTCQAPGRKKKNNNLK